MKSISPDYTLIAAKLRPDKQEINRLQGVAQKAVNILNKSLGSMTGVTKIKVIGSLATGFILRGTRDIDIIIHFKAFDKIKFRSRIGMINQFTNIKFSENNKIVVDKFNCNFMTMELSCGVITGDLSPETSLQADIFHHPDFWSKTSPPSIDDVLLCKQFFKVLNLYGTHIGGFAIELLVAYHKTFFKVLESFSNSCFIRVDYSSRYKFEDQFLEISYPYSGISNLVRDIGQLEAKIIRDYASKIILNPHRFKIDSQRVLTNNFWKRRFQKYQDEERFGMPDIFLSRREERELKKHILNRPCRKVLDAGCGNGFSTIQINKKGKHFTIGMDVSEPSIAAANKKADLYERISFIQGCLTQLPFSSNTFDIIYAKRSISNLPSIEAQQEALEELYRVMQKGGILLIQDLFKEGYEKLNSIRLKWNLPAIEIPYHIVPLEQAVIQDFFATIPGVVKCIDKTSTYYYLTRIIFARLSLWLNIELGNVSFLHKIAALMPTWGNLGLDRLYIYEKQIDN